MLLAPVVVKQKGEFRDVIERLAREGFVRARVDGELVELSSNVRVKLDPKQRHTIEAIVDRLVIDDKIRVRLSDSVETALKWGEGRLALLQQPGARRRNRGRGTNRSIPIAITARPPARVLITPTPKHFSFNSPLGACPVCHGLGQKMVFDEHLIVPDPEKSLEKGAVLPWRRGTKRMIVYYKALLRGMANHYGQSLETPWKDLPEDFRMKMLHGTGEEEIVFTLWRAGKTSQLQKPFEGIIPNLERLYVESESEFTKNRLEKFHEPAAVRCLRRTPAQAGNPRRHSRRRAGQLPFKGQATVPPGISIMDVCGMSVEQADEFFASLKLTDFQQKIAAELIQGNSRAAGLSEKCRPRLPDAGPRERHA